MTFDEAVLIDLHLRSSTHREEIQASARCGCFYCLNTFTPAELNEWIDEDTTALCPHCGVDAVLPDVTDLASLKAMHTYWFGEKG